MKKLILFILLIAFSFANAQKKELRNANKFFTAGEYSSAIDLLESSVDLFDSSDDKIKAQVMFLYGKLHTSMDDFELAIKAFDMSKNLGTSDQLLNPEINRLETAIITSAVGDNETENFSSAAVKLKLVYDLNTETNKEYLYYAASSAVNSLDYPLALEYYELLRDIKYDGIETKFFITEVSSGNEIEINSETEFNLLQKSKEYDNAREEDTDSKFPEIVKNIALIYKELGQNDKALAAIEAARLSNPDDVGLIMTAANIYFELGNKEAFKVAMSEAIEKEPNNPILYYNLGVVSSDLGEKDDAISYYEKSIDLDPTNENSYLNLVALILEGEQDIVSQMNSLGTSRSDNLKYDQLKESRENLYKQCIPILKDLIAINNNIEAIRTLMNIYGTIGDNAGYMEMKNLLEQQD
ncbi:MAG: tetratricopeptide repeat protein [Cryomorphaceae bacterium]|jgi:tetratricopeptide (TPR) repeat protein|nr:tetratricopeptide repeat protein [Cryomorphaceae bacterium]MBT5936127.1 tetratricopeptide repeat protein [Cryomorphaceae bacterium]MBT6317970.1 tetratricopeptide repeat protein [Cryomorphaceae bacterium]MBT6935639.1 tetratricopeptide repeat protein [Cryomorphaceae bacterium]MDG1889031.1 tetratricopeptide repeat protein [Flavobacteriaceae bacterium]